MAERDFTTSKDNEALRKVAALVAIEKAQEILTNLASIAVLRIHAASRADFADSVWRELYSETPWVARGEVPQEILPQCMEEELNKMIVKQAGLAWQELNEISIFGPEIYSLLAKRRLEGEGQEEEPGEPQQEAPASPPKQWEGPSPATLALIESIRNNIEDRADRLINPDPEAPLDAAAVAKIGQGIKWWATCITKDIGVRAALPKERPGGGV